MITVTILINDEPIMSLSAANTGLKSKDGKTVYRTDHGLELLHNPDDGAIELGKNLLEKHSFPYLFICRDCALVRGGVWPNMHAATIHTGVCKYCGKEKGLANLGDWNWPDGRARGMRD